MLGLFTKERGYTFSFRAEVSSGLTQIQGIAIQCVILDIYSFLYN